MWEWSSWSCTHKCWGEDKKSVWQEQGPRAGTKDWGARSKESCCSTFCWELKSLRPICKICGTTRCNTSDHTRPPHTGYACHVCRNKFIRSYHLRHHHQEHRAYLHIWWVVGEGRWWWCRLIIMSNWNRQVVFAASTTTSTWTQLELGLKRGYT